ncbi:MAG: LysM peptidoglycan-binding domain-containing protein [Desulfobacterota bacterium]|nr:LysM peptidoglycan-binding domain-containing protein [Thermodesulfobacteriota bacterium]
MERMFIAGVILMLASACHPRLALPPLSASSHPIGQEENNLSLFSRLELEALFSQPPAGVTEEETALAPPLSGEGQKGGGAFQFPISDEPSDDFCLEILSSGGDERKRFDIPIVINEKVEHFLNYFQTTGRKLFSNWLARSGKYIPFMREVLKANGLPEDLVYLAMIESGFNPYAYSRSKALGPWQFIYLTGKRYGLKSDWWVDERRDPEKSTIAAARYLKDLYDMFECWYLAAAGYNAGENKIANGMKRYRTEDFWELTKYRYLKKETKDYVPQMIAAALLAKDPEKYGFVGIDYEEPLQYDKVRVPPGMDLRIIAKACDISVEELKELNPELRRWCTPPNVPEYEIKIPFGKTEVFLKNFESVFASAPTTFKTHRVKRGETLQQIARLHRVDLEPLLEMNRLDRRSRLQAGMNLLLPLPNEKASAFSAAAPQGNGRFSESGEITYTIKKGDTLWSIANEMGVNIGALSAWNKLQPEGKLMPGDKIKIKVSDPLPSPPPPLEKEKDEIIYVVQPGDSLWSIANRFKISVAELKLWNQLEGKDRIYPNERLKLKLSKSKS